MIQRDDFAANPTRERISSRFPQNKHPLPMRLATLVFISSRTVIRELSISEHSVKRRMHIEIDLPESAFSALRLSPPQFVQEMRLAAALKWYEAGMVSQSKAAALAGLSREAFLLGAGRFGVSAIQATPVELAEELARD